MKLLILALLMIPPFLEIPEGKFNVEASAFIKSQSELVIYVTVTETTGKGIPATFEIQKVTVEWQDSIWETTFDKPSLRREHNHIQRTIRNGPKNWDKWVTVYVVIHDSRKGIWYRGGRQTVWVKPTF